MVMNWSGLCLVTVAVLGCLCNGQYSAQGKPKYQPPPPPQQTKQKYDTPLQWKFPIDPKEAPKPEVPFQLKYPVPAVTVAVECREKIAHVEVKKDMFGVGQLVNAADLLLGNCAAVAEDLAAQVLIFEAELHDCGSKLLMTDDAIIYSFILNYQPKAINGAPVLRTSPAAVIVECHYHRKHNVSSLPLEPQWVPFSAAKVAEEFLYFTLVLMTDDWQFERPSYQYFLGDTINVLVTVQQYFHVPLRVYVDSCTATLLPDMNSNPRYSFIDGHGCFIDAKLTGSASKFLPRSTENKLQMQLEAFRFPGAESGVLYITCHLRASSTAYVLDVNHRACSYINGWKEASGADGVCGTCDALAPGPVPNTSGGGGIASTKRKIREADQQQVAWDTYITFGPLAIDELAQ